MSQTETADRGTAVLPVLVVATGAAMLLVAAYAAVAGESGAAASFGSWAAVILAAGGLLSFVLRDSARAASAGNRLRDDVALLLFVWLVLPALAAMPVASALPALDFADAYFEMVSGFTTTGATVLDDLQNLPRSVLVWRSLSQWLGGLATLVAVLAVLAPHGLGAFAVEGLVQPRAPVRGAALGGPGTTHRWFRAAIRVAPLYAGLTAGLLIAYFLAGMNAFDAFNHALTTLSTGGFSTRDGSLSEFASWPIELVAATGMLLGAIGIGAYGRLWRRQWRRAGGDPEVRLLCLLVLAATLAAVLRHLLGAPGLEWSERATVVTATLWPEAFAAVSAVTTTGFSTAWADAGAGWSGLGPAAALLLGLAIAGGSAASTAGGVRLLTLSLLFRHSLDEFGRIGRPRYVRNARPIRDGASRLQIAWIGSMLFAMAAGAGILAVSTLGLDFEASLSAVVTSLANAGPLHSALVGRPDAWQQIPLEGKLICCLFMALGRVGVVSVVALLFLD